MKAYPVFLVGLEQRRAVVVGGDGVAQQKVQDLLDAGMGRVDVIHPRPSPELRRLAADPRVRLFARAYRQGDLAGAALAIATERDPETNARVYAEGEAAGVLVNAADDPPRCHFYAGSVVRRGDLVVAISTGGAVPALAVRLREKLERELSPEWGRWVARAGRLRSIVRARLAGPERKKFWYRLVDEVLR